MKASLSTHQSFRLLLQHKTLQGRIQDLKLEWAHLKNFWGYFVWKITILRQKNHIFFQFLGGRAPGAPLPGSAPVKDRQYNTHSQKEMGKKTNADPKPS